MNLEDKVALITGGSSGLGEATARELASHGAKIGVVDLPSSPGQKVVQSLGPNALFAAADVASATEVEKALAATVRKFGTVHILVNCAGLNLRPPLEELTTAGWDQTIAVNLTAPFLLGQRFGARMAARGWGRIINVTSQQSHRAFGHSGGYGAAKAGLAALTRSQSEAWARHGVCCNAICPGFVATPLTAPVASDPERSAALAARTMIGRNGEPGDFEGAAVFLASPASAYVTGQTLFVDGGFSAT